MSEAYKVRFRGEDNPNFKDGRTFARRDYSRLAVDKRRKHVATNGGSFTYEEWISLCARFGNRCLACGEHKKLTVDHVLAVSLGGTSDISNIQPLCHSCNSRKSAKHIDYRNAAPITAL
jgi:5-methylcytosine-specific restriction endonuclease McrA